MHIIDMEHKPDTEQVAMMGTLQMISPTDDLQIQHTRKILLIILGFYLALAVIFLVLVIVALGAMSDWTITERGVAVVLGLFPTLFYGFGFFAAHRYSPLGIRVFAGLYVIKLVLVDIWLLFSSSRVFHMLYFALDHGETRRLSTYSTIVLISFGMQLANFILSVIIIKLTLKLARLLDAYKR